MYRTVSPSGSAEELASKVTAWFTSGTFGSYVNAAVGGTLTSTFVDSVSVSLVTLAS